MQGLVELAGQLRGRLQGGIASIRSIDVSMSRQAVTILGGPGARTGRLNRETADHTPGFAIAAVLHAGQLSPADYGRLLDDETVLSLMGKVSLQEDAQASAAYPRHLPARLRARLADGRELEVSQSDPGSVDRDAFLRKLDTLWPADRTRDWPWRLGGSAPPFPR